MFPKIIAIFKFNIPYTHTHTYMYIYIRDEYVEHTEPGAV